MDDSFAMEIDQSPEKLSHDGSRILLIGFFGDYPFEEFSSLA